MKRPINTHKALEVYKKQQDEEATYMSFPFQALL